MNNKKEKNYFTLLTHLKLARHLKPERYQNNENMRYLNYNYLSNKLNLKPRRIRQLLKECIELGYIYIVNNSYLHTKEKHFHRVGGINKIPDVSNTISDQVNLDILNTKLKPVSYYYNTQKEDVDYLNTFKNTPFRKLKIAELSGLTSRLRLSLSLMNLNDRITILLNDHKEELKNQKYTFDCEVIRWHTKATFKRTKTGYSLKIGGRATNALSSLDKEIIRPEYLRRTGYEEHDVRCSIFNRNIQLNGGTFDSERNIRKELLERSRLSKYVTEAEMKPVMNRMYFAKSGKQARQWLKRGKLNADCIFRAEELWTMLREIIGPTHGTEIFEFESREMIKEMKERGATGLIYDCLMY